MVYAHGVLHEDVAVMVFNVADLRKLIQDLDDDTIVQVDDGNVYSGIDDAVVLHNKRSDKRKVLSLHTQRLFNEQKKVDDYYVKGEEVLSPFGDGNWDANIIHNDG